MLAGSAWCADVTEKATVAAVRSGMVSEALVEQQLASVLEWFNTPQHSQKTTNFFKNINFLYIYKQTRNWRLICNFLHILLLYITLNPYIRVDNLLISFLKSTIQKYWTQKQMREGAVVSHLMARPPTPPHFILYGRLK